MMPMELLSNTDKKKIIKIQIKKSETICEKRDDTEESTLSYSDLFNLHLTQEDVELFSKASKNIANPRVQTIMKTLSIGNGGA